METTEIRSTKSPIDPVGKQQFEVCAYYLGEQIDLRRVTNGRRLAARPLTLAIETGGLMVVFRYGAVVFIDVKPEEITKISAELRSLADHPYVQPESETVTVRIDPDSNERMEAGVVTLHNSDILRLQTLASVLGKTVVLGQYESDVANTFDRIEPFAVELEQHGRGGGRLRELLRHIGRALLNEHKLLGRVEVADKPELLWDHPELEPLYARLEAEYELSERAGMLDRKLELIARTVRTVLDLLENKRSLRVEWYIVVLIVVEIGLSLYEMFVHQ